MFLLGEVLEHAGTTHLSNQMVLNYLLEIQSHLRGILQILHITL